MVWIKRLMIIVVLAFLIVTCTGLIDQTGSHTDDWILAKAEIASGKKSGTEIYFSEQKETTEIGGDPFFRDAEKEDDSAEDPPQKLVSGNTLTDASLQTGQSGEKNEAEAIAELPSDIGNLTYETKESQTDEDLPKVSSHDWELMLVNKQHPIPEDYEVELGSIHNGLKVDKRITKALDDMLSAAADDGVRLLVISPYRTTARQKELFDKKVRRAMKQGMSYLEAYKDTAQTVTIPGFSEHECGLAADITTKEHITLDAAYSETEGGMWLSAHCSEYGFILRYPVGKEEITGIEFEPWHFRYVGKQAAAYIMEHELTLEEFVHMLKTAESDVEEE